MITRLQKLLNSSIGKKTFMAISGLLLVGFLIMHLLGNLQLFADEDGSAFQAYAQKLHDFGPLLWVARLGLLALFSIHIYLGLKVSLESREARCQRYAVRQSMGKMTPASASMLVTGSLVLVFLIVHITDFSANPSVGIPDLSNAVKERLSSPGGIAIYLIGLIALGVHLAHAFRSSLQTLGVNHPRYNGMIQGAGIGLATLLFLGFAAFPIFLSGPSDPEEGASLPPTLSPTSTPSAVESPERLELPAEEDSNR